jgi:hypothetical protein
MTADGEGMTTMKSDKDTVELFEKQAQGVIRILKDMPEPVLQRVEAALRGRLRFGKW